MPHGVPLVVVFLSRLAAILALSERRASNQRNQRESSDKHLHDTSPCYGRSTGLAVENVQSIDLNGFVEHASSPLFELHRRRVDGVCQ